SRATHLGNPRDFPFFDRDIVEGDVHAGGGDKGGEAIPRQEAAASAGNYGEPEPGPELHRAPPLHLTRSIMRQWVRMFRCKVRGKVDRGRPFGGGRGGCRRGGDSRGVSSSRRPRAGVL